MRTVEEYIGGLLRSNKPQEVKNGLANVLYWGHAGGPFRDSSVRNFIGTNPNELAPKLNRFVELAKELKGASNSGEAGAGRSDLLKIQKLKIPQFGDGMSFVSKILMFLDPERYPVLDRKIAKAYANSFFSPLQDLKLYNTSIPISKENNVAVYDTWACWCRQIARVVKETPESPCHVRAVDVERALFTLAKLNKIATACPLLTGPEGWTFKRCST